MKKIYIIFITFCALAGVISCESDNGYNISTSIDKYETGENIRISNIAFHSNNTGLLCGGEKNSSGSIYKTTDGGETWTLCFHSDSLSVNDIFYLSDSIVYACGDSLLFLKSADAGDSWEIINMDNLPYEEYKVPYNSVYAFSENKIYLTGGEHYNKGLWSKTETGNYSWTHDTYDNQFNSMCFVSEYVGFFGGYGILIVTEDGGNTFDYIDLGSNNFTDLETDQNLTVYALSDSGTLYETTDLGYNWNTLINDSSEEFTDMDFGKNLSVICGKDGCIYLRYTNQSAWSKAGNIPAVNFYCSYVKDNDEVVLGSDNGVVYILNHKRTI